MGKEYVFIAYVFCDDCGEENALLPGDPDPRCHGCGAPLDPLCAESADDLDPSEFA